KLRCALYSVLSSIHIALDLWTSPNHLALFGIIAYYTDENGILQQSTLAIRELEGQYTKENLSAVFLNIIWEFGIQNKLSFFMGDNAINNDTMIQFITDELIKEGIEYNPVLH